VSLEEFKKILEIDDREDALCRFVLIASTYTIEQYCKRRLLSKRRLEFFPFYGDYVFPLGDYPVREIMAVQHIHPQKEITIVDPELYHTAPGIGTVEDAPFCLWVSPTLRLVREAAGLRVHYRAGYVPGRVPADLASACLELAAWNLNRYRGRKIGMVGNGKGGEQLETSMPENVKALLEPYRRKTI
jgi:uncharacterized phiE125 gp8 family phage protein